MIICILKRRLSEDTENGIEWSFIRIKKIDWLISYGKKMSLVVAPHWNVDDMTMLHIGRWWTLPEPRCLLQFMLFTQLEVMHVSKNGELTGIGWTYEYKVYAAGMQCLYCTQMCSVVKEWPKQQWHEESNELRHCFGCDGAGTWDN